MSNKKPRICGAMFIISCKKLNQSIACPTKLHNGNSGHSLFLDVYVIVFAALLF
jgi:hypothetical protein